MKCLLCGGGSTRSVWRLTGNELRELFREAGHSLSEEAFGKVTPEYVIQLFHCDGCGFEFFDPTLAGSGKFYEDLDRGTYYVQERPEFAFALKHIAEHRARSVLDVGCGEGAFLDLARAKGMKTLGIELNQTAVVAARAKGHSMLSEKVEEITPEQIGGRLDAITLFQVVEHLPNPHDFIDAATKLLRPGGLLIISVPNRHGIFRLVPLDPANLPPHHITRWRARDLRRLASAHGFACLGTRADILSGAGIADFWHAQNRFAKAIQQEGFPGGSWFPDLVSFFYRKLGCRYFFPRWGMSVYAAFQKEPYE
jgi:SAM-dependent methyltransferase